jgi:hypothetical protein
MRHGDWPKFTRDNATTFDVVEGRTVALAFRAGDVIRCRHRPLIEITMLGQNSTVNPTSRIRPRFPAFAHKTPSP